MKKLIPINRAKVAVGKTAMKDTFDDREKYWNCQLDSQFAIIGEMEVVFYKKLEKAVEILIENYNLTKITYHFMKIPWYNSSR